jgi:hypothetical protein
MTAPIVANVVVEFNDSCNLMVRILPKCAVHVNRASSQQTCSCRVTQFGLVAALAARSLLLPQVYRAASPKAKLDMASLTISMSAVNFVGHIGTRPNVLQDAPAPAPRLTDVCIRTRPHLRRD